MKDVVSFNICYFCFSVSPDIHREQRHGEHQILAAVPSDDVLGEGDRGSFECLRRGGEVHMAGFETVGFARSRSSVEVRWVEVGTAQDGNGDVSP